MTFKKLHQHAVIGFTGNDRNSLLAALHQVRKSVQAELAICIGVVVAVDAVGVEERDDLLGVVHGLGVGGDREKREEKDGTERGHAVFLVSD